MACWLSLNQHDNKSWWELLPCSFIVSWISRCPYLITTDSAHAYRSELVLPMRSVWLESFQSCNQRSKWPWKRYISKTRHLGSLSEDPTTEEKSTLSKCTSRGSVRRIAHAHMYSMHVHASYITCHREFPTVHFAVGWQSRQSRCPRAKTNPSFQR